MHETEHALNHHTCNFTTDRKWGEYKCKICDIELTTKEQYNSHHRTFHIHEKMFECDQCDYKAKVPSALMAHKKRKHTKIKDEICDICGKSFYDIYSLKNHMKIIHVSPNENRDFICDKCGAAFYTANTLRGHIREKHPVYYICTICDQLFQSSKKLRLHYFQG